MHERKNLEQRAATAAAINYLYRNKRDNPEFQIAILADLLESDGCTSAPDLCFKHCCHNHDIAYRTGRDASGNLVSRLEADLVFLRCMTHTARTEKQAAEVLAPIYFACVRVFGESLWHDYIAPWRPEPLGD